MANSLPPADPDAPKAKGRGLRIALLLSLALNIAVFFAVIGFLASNRAGGGHPRGFDLGLGPIAAAFDKEDRDDIRRRLQDRGDFRPLARRDQQDRIAELAAIVRADPFDANALADAFGRIQDRTVGLQAAAQAIVIEKISEMSADERNVFATDMMAAANRRGPPRRP